MGMQNSLIMSIRSKSTKMFCHKVLDFLRVKLDSREYKVYNLLVESFLIWAAKFRVYFTKIFLKSPKLSNLVLIFILVESFYIESSISICKRFQISMYKVLYLVV